MSQLFAPVHIGRLTLPSRLVMAPMTRSRADAGQLFSKSVYPGAMGKGYTDCPTLNASAAI